MKAHESLVSQYTKEELEDALAEKKKREMELQALPVEQRRLATFLHEELCHENHTDGCSWFYEKWNGLPLGLARDYYVSMAQRMLAIGLSEDAIKKVVLAIKGGQWPSTAS